jgi:cation transporter-like permease
MTSTEDLKVGNAVAHLIVEESRDSFLRLATSSSMNLSALSLLVSTAIAVFNHFTPGHHSSIGFLIAGVALTFLSLKFSWLSYNFDGTAGEVVRRHGPFSQRWPVATLAGVTLEAIRMGSTDAVRMGLKFRDGTKPFYIAHRPAKSRANELTVAAQRIANVLNIPLLPTGQVSTVGEAVQQALAAVQPEAAAGDGRDLVIHCPKCGRPNTSARAYQGPVDRHITWVKCMACNGKLYSKLPANELTGLSPEQLSTIVVHPDSRGMRLFAILAIALCIFPYVGLIASAISTATNWKITGWPKRVSVIALAISVVMTALVTYVSMTEKPTPARVRHHRPDAAAANHAQN